MQALLLLSPDFFDIPYLNKDNLHQWVSIEGLDNYKDADKEGKVLRFWRSFWQLGNRECGFGNNDASL